MSSEIFKWQPQIKQLVENTQYNVISSEYETGAKQRRVRFPREVGGWQMNFIVGLFNPVTKKKVQDEIKAFFKARQGSYDNFYLPSWEFEGNTALPCASGQSDIVLDVDAAGAGFSVIAGAQGSLLFVCDRYCTGYSGTDTVQEVCRVSSIDGNTVTISGEFNDTYAVGAKVMKAYKVHFNMDILPRSFDDSPYMYSAPLEFTEDLGGLY